jgi:hypothetical protein
MSGGRVYLAPTGMRLGVSAAGFDVTPLAPPSSSWLTCGDHLINTACGALWCAQHRHRAQGRDAGRHRRLAAVKACGVSHQLGVSAAIDLAKAEIVMLPQRMASVLQIIAEGWNGAAGDSRTQPAAAWSRRHPA